MKYFLLKIKKHFKTLLQFAVVFGAAFVVLLYFLGYYDLSFLDRYAIFDSPSGSAETSPASPFPSVDMSGVGAESGADASGSSQNPAETPDDPTNGSPSASQSADPAPTNVAKVFAPDDLADKMNTIPTVADSLADGNIAAPADGSYLYQNGRTSLAKLTFDFKLPARYANRNRLAEKMTVYTPGENGEDTSQMISDEKYVIYETVKESRPAIELYMGYILLDDGENFYILSSDGVPLCSYDGNRYTPAYTRDLQDRPLFTRTDDGEVRYFYLAANDNGVMSFVLSDYDPLTDNRGLYFDYPANWGKSDSTSVFVISHEFAEVGGSLTSLDSLIASIEAERAAETTEETAETTETEEFDAEAVIAALGYPTKTLFGYEVRNAEGYVLGPLTSLKFTTAYPFMQNRAAVTTESDRGSLYFINQNGAKAFVNTRMYLNEYDRYSNEYLLPPLTDGIESIGSYYYDNGLVRVRRQVIDYWNYAMRGLTRVVKDYECLLRLDGTEYALPAGFELEGYSEGMAILSKNGLYGVYDVVGEWIAQPIYSSATPFIGGLSVLTLPDGRCGMIDKQGNIVLPFTYDSISQVSSGIIATYRSENGWAVYKVMDKAME